MVDVHFLQNGGTVVGDGDIAIGVDEHFVHPLGPKGGAEDLGDGAGGHDVGLYVCVGGGRGGGGGSEFVCVCVFRERKAGEG